MIVARIGVIGGGAFGTAMACVMRRAGHEVNLWAREPEVVTAINEHEANPVYLKGLRLVPGIRATAVLAEAAAGAEFLLLAPPAQHMRSVTGALQPLLAAGTPVVSCSKGIERGTCLLMPQVLAETLPGTPVAVMSGPSFAHDLAADRPAGVTLACTDGGLGKRLAGAIGTPRFRVYETDDVTGTALGGVLKNVIAIACGVAMGARFETFLGLSGAGDLSLACNSASSRNTSLGIALGEGRRLADVLRERVTVQEGVHSAESVAALAQHHGVDMPIVTAVDQVLNHGADLDAEIMRLLAHPAGTERAAK
jgi:glycerol-3-phosphate dehydrogenase (NAD(P)+)